MKNESGRSMVEMMGVLAVMGVLSVAGMKGYSMAMNKIQSNKIAELASEISTIAQTRNKCLNLNDKNISDELDDFTWPECLNFVVASPEGQVKLIFKDEDACDSIANMLATLLGKCRWVDLAGKEDAYLFFPTRGSEEGREEECDGTNDPDSYIASNCI